MIRLIDVVKNQKSLMLDEFDASLHTRLADFILDLIHASSKAQFLFTSHNTNLIDVKRLRKDQIVFVNKNNCRKKGVLKNFHLVNKLHYKLLCRFNLRKN